MKRAIVFGASGDIGKAICYQMAKDGWSIYLHYYSNEMQVIKMQKDLQNKFPNQDFFKVKLDFLADDKQLVKFVKNLFSVNAVVFAQGITHYGLLGQEKLDNISAIMNINLIVPIKLIRLFENVLLRQDFARIIFISSVYGLQASALESVYSSSKAGIIRFAQGYSRETASSNLTVNVLAPGAVDTKMNNIFSQQDLADLKNAIPASRFAKVEDISYWTSVLLSQKSNYLTGQTIAISGGWLV